MRPTIKRTQLTMGMPVTIAVVDVKASQTDLDTVFLSFHSVDERFSPYKEQSEISCINRGEIGEGDYSNEMRQILALAEQTKAETNGFFNIYHNNYCDPSGIVKGWAIQHATQMLADMGYKNYYVDAGGDIQTAGLNKQGQPWRVGIRNPFNQTEIIKVLNLTNKGVATSGTYIRGDHIYNPHTSCHPRQEQRQPDRGSLHRQEIPDRVSAKAKPAGSSRMRVRHSSETLRSFTLPQDGQEPQIVSLTVIGDSIYDADRFATAAFAMGQQGIDFIESRPEFEGYMIDQDGRATYTTHFSSYVNSKS